MESRKYKMDSLTANIAIEITFDCYIFDGKIEKHRLWITRDGKVIAPDHKSEEEEIVMALGGKVSNSCVYWQAIPLSMQYSKKENQLKVPDISSWEITNSSFWNKRLGWLFLTAITGEPTLGQLDSELALEHAKIYQKYKNDESFELFSELEYLQSPWKRSGGYRRNSIVTKVELENMIKTRLPINRVASALALGLQANQVETAIGLFQENNLPSDLVVNLAHLISGERILGLLPKMSAKNIKALPYLLSDFVNHSENIFDKDIESYLLGE